MTQPRAMLCALAGFFAWVVVDVAIKLGAQGQAALSPFVIMAVLGTFGAVSLAASSIIRHKVAALHPCSLREQSVIALCSIGINYGNVVALKHLPLTMYYIVVFTTPLMIALLSAILKHEQLKFVKIACLVAGFCGTAFAIGIHGGGGDWLGYLAAFIVVSFFATYTILMRKIASTDSVESTQFINALCVSVVGIAGALSQSSAAPAGWALAMMIVAGGINVLGNVLYNTALQNTASTNVAQLHYTQIISGAIFGYFLWHEIPTWNLIAGSILIITAGILVARQVRKNNGTAR